MMVGQAGATTDPNDCATLGMQPPVMKYDMAVQQWEAAFNDPAVRDCSTTASCLSYATPAKTCFAITEGFDTTMLDTLDTAQNDAYDALTAAEQACRPRGSAQCNPTPTCVAGVCM